MRRYPVPLVPILGAVTIGCGWGSNPFVARSAYHHFEDPPTYQDHHIGFRVVSEQE
jgi:formylglycine-generating enzyme required for sulfatase activity